MCIDHSEVVYFDLGSNAKVEIKVVGCNYFPALIASANSHPAAVFWVTWSFLGGSNTEVHLKRCCEEYAVHLSDKNCSYLLCVKLQPYSRVNEGGCKVIWEQFGPWNLKK